MLMLDIICINGENSEVVDAKQKFANTVIWLHGLGADASDFVPIVHKLNTTNTKFIFPNAPIMPITINGGMRMRGWFDIRDMDFCNNPDIKGIESSVDIVEEIVSKEIELGLQHQDITLAGFSQGGVIALKSAIRLQTEKNLNYKSIIALSTFLPKPKIIKINSPLFFAHGEYDEIVKTNWAKNTVSALIKAGSKVYWHLYPMAHSVCDKEITDIKDFLKQNNYYGK